MATSDEYGPTPLRGQVWCENGHLCSGMARYCGYCGVDLGDD